LRSFPGLDMPLGQAPLETARAVATRNTRDVCHPVLDFDGNTSGRYLAGDGELAGDSNHSLATEPGTHRRPRQTARSRERCFGHGATLMATTRTTTFARGPKRRPVPAR